MKKKLFFLASLLALTSLSACGTSNVESHKMKMNSLCTGEEYEISYYTFIGKEHIPYFSLTSYFSLYKHIMIKGCTFEITKSSYRPTIYIKDASKELVFVSQINNSSKTLIANGDYSTVFTTQKDYSNSSLSLYSSNSYEIVDGTQQVRELSFKDMNFSIFHKNNDTYYPLSFLEATYASFAGVNHLYNYKRLLQFTDYEQLKEVKINTEYGLLSAHQEMSKYIEANMPVMPSYLIEDRKAAFLYIFENKYGAKYVKNISSMADYFARQSSFSDFLNSDLNKRRAAYCDVFTLLDDGHTSPRDDADYPYNVGNYSYYGPKLIQMLTVRQNLSTSRNLTPGLVHYSNDQTVAFFTFDSFTFAMEAHLSDGSLKPGLSDYNSEDYDSFFYFVKALNEIKSKGTVKKVIIDISTNGGGTVGVMTKLLTLISKNNSSLLYMYSDLFNIVQEIETKVDSNMDGQFDSKDVYGNDFEFYILTSFFSYSCGNAFPFIASKSGLAKIIGVKSGGGECAVSEEYLPSGEHFYHSSHLHIGWWNQIDSFIGGESGASIDIPIEYKDFFNLEKLQELIS